MRLEDLFEQPAVALTGQGGVMGTGLDPAQFNSRYGMSPAQANQTVNRIVRLNPQFRTPQFRNAITNYLMDNPKSLQAANQNLRIPANQNVRPTSTPKGNLGWLRGLAGRALGTVGLILNPTTMGDGTIDPDSQAAWQAADEVMRHMATNNPAAYIEFINNEYESMDPEERQRMDPRTHPYYADAQAQLAADEYAGGDTAGEFNVSPGPQAQTTTPTQPALPSGDVDLGMDADAQTGTWTPPVVSAPPQLTPQDLDVDIPQTTDVELPPPPAAMTQAPAQTPLPSGDVDLGMDADTQTGDWTPPPAPQELEVPRDDTAPSVTTTTPGPQVKTDVEVPEIPAPGDADAGTVTAPEVPGPQRSPTPQRVTPPQPTTTPEVPTEVPTPTPTPVVTPRVPGQPTVPDETPSTPEVPGPETKPQTTPSPQQPTVPEPETTPTPSTTTAPAPAPRVLPRPATATSPSGTGGRGKGRGKGRFRLPRVGLDQKQPDFDYVSWDPMATPDPLKLKQYRATKKYPG